MKLSLRELIAMSVGTIQIPDTLLIHHKNEFLAIRLVDKKTIRNWTFKYRIKKIEIHKDPNKPLKKNKDPKWLKNHYSIIKLLSAIINLF